MEKTSIVILTYNQLNYTKLCIESVFKATSPIRTPYELIVVDNASTDGTIEYLKGLETAKQIHVIYNKENVGFPKGNNQAAAVATGQHICLLNNDTILTNGWLEDLLRVLRGDPKIAAVGPYCNHSSGHQKVEGIEPYKDDKELEALSRKFNTPTKEVNFLVFFCCLIKRKVWDEVGGLDEDFTPGNYEDNLFCYKVIERGYTLKVVSRYIHHWGSVSWKGESADPVKYKAYLKLLGHNQKIFFKKIGKYKKISLCMICGDYEKPETLKRCLDSVIDYIDELCIVFNYKYYKKRKLPTLSWTLEENDRLGVKKDYVKWTTFSDMRNKSLDMATGDYVFILDVDDTLITPQGPRDLAYQFPDKDYFKCCTHSRNEYGGEDKIMQCRFFKNKKEFRYTKLVHEDITTSMLAVKASGMSTNIGIHHLGYDSRKTVLKKNKRNLQLTYKEIKSGEADQLTYFHLISSMVVGSEDWSNKRKYNQLIKVIKYIDFTLDYFKLLPKDPLTTKLWVARGRICADCGQPKAAKQWLLKAWLNNKNPEAGVNLAECYILEKKIDEALEILTEMEKIESFAMANMPFNQKEVETLMLFKLGNCWSTKKDWPKAEKAYRECISVDRNHILASDRLCQILRNTNRAGEANLITVNLINKFPTYFSGWFNLSQYEIFHKRWATAEVFLRKCLEINPKFEEALINMKAINQIKGGKK